MFRRIVDRADRLFVIAHSVVWTVVMIVWSLAWRESHGPWWPQFNFAKRFLSRVDGAVSGSIDAVSVPLARVGGSAFGGDFGLWYAIIFAGLMLLGGSIQWFLIGRLLRFVGSKYGGVAAAILACCLMISVALAGVSWAMSW